MQKNKFLIFVAFVCNSSNSPHRLQACAWSDDDRRRAGVGVGGWTELVAEDDDDEVVLVQVDAVAVLVAVLVVYFGVLGGAFVL